MRDMGWVRFHRRYGAWPGLAALVLQLALSFGHIHIGNVHVDAAWHSAIGAAAKSEPVVLAQSQHQSPSHDSGQSSGDGDDYCAICASIFLASTSLAAQPPLLVVPVHFERVALSFDAERGIAASRPAFFRSRAPPLA
jgi:hypothetical protein